MSELYKILDPKDVPADLRIGGGRSKGALRLAMEQMEVGDFITIPLKSKDQVGYIALKLGRRYSYRQFDGVVYVQRLPDDAS